MNVAVCSPSSQTYILQVIMVYPHGESSWREDQTQGVPESGMMVTYGVSLCGTPKGGLQEFLVNMGKEP